MIHSASFTDSGAMTWQAPSITEQIPPAVTEFISIENTTNPVDIQYALCDGDDIVYGYNSNDTVQIISGEYVTSTSGQDIIITVGAGKITLFGNQGQKLNVLREPIKIADITKKKMPPTLSKTFRGKTIDLANYSVTADYPVNVTGNSFGNSMKGGKVDDTILGGIDNDTMPAGLYNHRRYRRKKKLTKFLTAQVRINFSVATATTPKAKLPPRLIPALSLAVLPFCLPTTT